VTAKLAALTAGLVMLLLAPAGAKAKTFTPIPAQQFKLVKHGFGKATKRRISQLAQAYPRVGLNALLGDTNRVNTPLMPGLRPNGAFGYSWESGDNSVDYWTPQGITGNGNGVQAISWYKGKSGGEQGVRISFVNRGEGAHGEYRFGLAVVPKGGQSFAQVKVHAGGVAWVGKYLYMADTNNGVRVFDLTRTLRVPDSRLGTTGNYRYLLPQIGHYQRQGGLKFSALALDRSNPKKPAIVAGEYQVYENHDPVTRIARWRIGPKSKLLAGQAASQAWKTGFDQLQGVITNHGQVYVSSTQGPRGLLYHGKPSKKAKVNKWGAGPEGLYATTTQLWTLTEAKDHRTVFGKTFSSLN
jgi:hypothetical protein